MRLLLMMMLLFPIQVFSGPYEDAQQYGQTGTNAIAGNISNGSVTNQSVPGFQTSTPPEAQLNNQAALNNAALLGTAQDTSGAGQFIYNSNANNAQFTFSPNDPLITGSNQIQADAYTTMSALNPSNTGATTCVDIVTNTTGIVDTYTCNQSRPGTQVLCSRDLSVSVSSNSSCVLGSLLKIVQMGRFSVEVYCNPLSQIKVSTDIQDYYPATILPVSQSINAGNSGSVLMGTDIVWVGNMLDRFMLDDTIAEARLYKSGNHPYSGMPYTKDYSYGTNNIRKLVFSPIYFDYTNTCTGSVCTLTVGGSSMNYSLQHTVYSYTDTWGSYLCN